MSSREFERRVLLRNVGYVGGGLLLFGGCTSDGKPDGTNKQAALSAVEGGEVVTDPAKFPTAFKESPAFAAQVAAGKLPKVAERIGQDPLVIKPVHEIGKYGGQLRRVFGGASDFQNANRFCAGPDNLLYWDYRYEKVQSNIARGFELSADNRELTLHLRRGMKWSDGHPFTADDILFWRNDISLNGALAKGASSLRLRGRDVVVEKVDDFTVVYRCPAPYALLPELLAGTTDLGGQSFAGARGGGGYAPKHYLSKFHPEYTSEAAANALARAAGLATWPLFLLNRNSWFLNPELPMLTPWVVTRPINNPPWEFAANPYSIWVDSEGNQLPYIPKITMAVAKDADVVSLRAASGQIDFQDRGLPVEKMPVLIKNQERGNYTVRRAPGDSMDCAIRLNLAYDKDREIGELLRTVEFRRALSLGIDREQINQTFFLGSSIPSASMPAKTSPYYPGDEWQLKWATHDVAQANQLLDQIGLTKKDPQGFRLRRSGKGRIRLSLESAVSTLNYPSIGEMIRKHWSRIGIDVTNRSVEGVLLVERTLTNELMMSVNTVSTDDPFSLPNTILTTNTDFYDGLIGIPYAKWFASDGKSGVEPPESVRALKDAIALYRRGVEVDRAARAQLGQQLFKLHVDQVWSIGLAGFGLTLNGLYCAKNNLGNVPVRIVNNTPMKSPSNVLPMTFYYR